MDCHPPGAWPTRIRSERDEDYLLNRWMYEQSPSKRLVLPPLHTRWRRFGDPLADPPPRKPRRWVHIPGDLNIHEPCQRGHMLDYSILMENDEGERACRKCLAEDRAIRKLRPCQVDGCAKPRHNWSDPSTVKYHMEKNRADPENWDDVLGVFVDKQPGDDGCWLWTWTVNVHGYGTLTFRGKPWYAHRVSYTLATGPIVDDLTVDHICFVRNCLRPSHLRLLPHAENAARHKPKESDQSHEVGAM